LAVAKVADGEDDEEELKSPDEPSSGSITDEEFADVVLKQLLAVSFAVAVEEVDVAIVGIDEPL
jgi:hypothetical protein